MASGAKSTGRKYALLVGVNEYAPGSDIPPLSCAEQDVRALAGVLERHCGFATRTMCGREATSDAVSSFLEKPRFGGRKLTHNDQFLFFFAGHGQLTRGDYVLHTYDAKWGRTRKSIRVEDLSGMLEDDVPCRECMCILDACRNTAAPGARGVALGHDASREIGRVVDKPDKTLLRVLFGCKENGCSWEDTSLQLPEDDRPGHGVLTYHLCRALQGEHTSALNFEDLTDLVAFKMRAYRHPIHGEVSQQPHLYRSAGPERIWIKGAESTTPGKGTKAQVHSPQASHAQASGTVQVHIVTEPPGALVWVNGRRCGNSPVTLNAHAGRLRIRAEMVGFAAQERALECDGVTNQEVRFCLTTRVDSEDPVSPHSGRFVWARRLALHILGTLCYKASPIPQNYEKAARCFRKAAELGHIVSQYKLGMCYEHGEGVPQDSAVAARCFLKAAEQGHAQAQSTLGTCYEEGRGVPRDDTKAVCWTRKAAEQGNVTAQYKLGSYYFIGTGVPGNVTEGVKWYRAAAERGYARAQCELGILHSIGMGVPKIEEEAVRWYRKAAAQGYADAQYHLVSWPGWKRSGRCLG